MPRARPLKPSPKPGGGGRGVTKIDIEIGGRIRAMRMDKRMSQQKLGELCGLTFQQIQKYERGKNRVSMSRARQIASILGTNIETLAGTDGVVIDGFAFDAESYKLAREFVKLPDRLKAKLRSLITSIINE